MTYIIRNYQDALNLRQNIASYQTSGGHFFYRGHADKTFKLLSTVGRKSPMLTNLIDSEKECLKEFKDLVQGENLLRFKVNSYNTNLFYMSIGRHLGLNCRLLDWSSSLETALFFASSDKDYAERDGVLWVMLYKGDVFAKNATQEPFKVNEMLLIKEDYLLPPLDIIENQPLGILRRFRQNGYFTIMPTSLAKIPLNELATEFVQFIPITITAIAKKDIMKKVPRNNFLLYVKEDYRIVDDIKVINEKYFK